MGGLGSEVEHREGGRGAGQTGPEEQKRRRECLHRRSGRRVAGYGGRQQKDAMTYDVPVSGHHRRTRCSIHCSIHSTELILQRTEQEAAVSAVYSHSYSYSSIHTTAGATLCKKKCS